MKLKSSKKTILVLVLALIMTTGMFSGCTGSKESSNNADVKTVTVWSGNTHSKNVVQELVDEFNNGVGKEKGIAIDYQVKDSSSYNQTIELALQSGEAPDMFTTTLVKAVENDYVLPLEELPGGEDFLKKYKSYEREKTNTYQGKHYCVPIGIVTQGLIYNKDMFVEAGIVDKNGEAKAPETWDEVREYAKKLTNEKEMKYGIVFPIKWSGWYASDIHAPLMSSAGFLGYNPVNGKYDFSKLQPITEAIMGIKADKSYYPGAEGMDNDPARAYFASGNVGMKFAFSFDYGVLTEQFPAECEWGVAPYPVVDKNEKYKQRADYGQSFLINKKSLETVGGEALMEVYKFFTGDDYAIAMYKAGMTIPYDFDIVKDVKLDKRMEQWKEFAKLADISSVYPLEPSKDALIAANPYNTFVNEVWPGKMTPAEFVKKLETSYTKAADEYYKQNPNENRDSLINKDWNIKR